MNWVEISIQNLIKLSFKIKNINYILIKPFQILKVIKNNPKVLGQLPFFG